VDEDLKIFSGGANRALSEEICTYLGLPLGEADLTTFPDGELYVQVLENVRGKDVFVVQPTCQPVNDNLVELLIMIDTFKRASARRITAVMPYYGYARQDRKDKPRVPITAKLVADLLTAAGANRVLTMDLHAGQIQGFFSIPVDNLFATPVILEYIRQQPWQDLTVVAPDPGAVERARAYAKRLEADLVIIDKRRSGPTQVEVMNVIGEVDGCDVLFCDDIISTGGTLIRAVEALKKRGARRVTASATHPVLAGRSVQLIEESEIEQVIVTNTIPLEARKAIPKIKVLSVAGLLGDAIKSIHQETSVSRLFV
jgi:ribose-phosphate pyrophosphokinase